MRTQTGYRVILTVGVALMLFTLLPLRPAWAQPDALISDDFLPFYPEGPDYNIFMGSAGSGLFLNNMERCDTNEEAARLNDIANRRRTVGEGTVACEALVSLLEDACFAGIAISAANLVNRERDFVPCELQDQLVDGAEIEAAYENTRILHMNLLTHDFNVAEHINRFAAFDTFIRGSILTIVNSLTAINDRVNANGDLLTSVFAQVISNGTQLERLTELVQTPPGRREDFPIKP